MDNTKLYDDMIMEWYRIRLNRYGETNYLDKLMSSALRTCLTTRSRELGDEGRHYVFDKYFEQTIFEAKFFDTYRDIFEITHIGNLEYYYGWRVFVNILHKGKEISAYFRHKPKNKIKKYSFMGESAGSVVEVLDLVIKNNLDLLLERFKSDGMHAYEQMLFSNNISIEKIDEYFKLYE
jgi:hypothetical protein